MGVEPVLTRLAIDYRRVERTKYGLWKSEMQN